MPSMPSVLRGVSEEKRNAHGHDYMTCFSLSAFKFRFTGNAGHGSILLPNTAGEKLGYVVNKMMEFRASQVKRLEDDPNLFFGDVTTVNLTQLVGGQQNNVVPAELEVVFDLRVAIDVDLVWLEQKALQWCEEAGGGVELEFIRKDDFVPPTKIGEESPFWTAFESAMTELLVSKRNSTWHKMFF